MITRQTIGYVMNQMGIALGIPIVRSKQSQKRPLPYPYGVWTTISHQEESAHMNARQFYDAGSGTMMVVTHERTKATVSLAFVDSDDAAAGSNRSSLDTLTSLCERAVLWLKYPSSGVDICYATGVVPRLNAPNIQDRSTYLEADYENRYGFDFRLDSTPKASGVTQAIEATIVTPVVDGTARPPFIIQSPS